MFRFLARLGGLLLGIGLLQGPPERAQTRDMVLATTTSTQDSGLLDSLLPLFRARSGIEVKVIAVGSGAALAMAKTGDADAVLVHAPEAERPYVESRDLVAGSALAGRIPVPPALGLCDDVAVNGANWAGGSVPRAWESCAVRTSSGAAGSHICG